MLEHSTGFGVVDLDVLEPSVVPAAKELVEVVPREEANSLPSPLEHVVLLELAFDRPPLRAQAPVCGRVDVEDEEAARAKHTTNLAEDRMRRRSAEHVQGDVRHYRVEAPILERQQLGDVRNHEVDGGAVRVARAPDGFAREIRRDDDQTRVREARRIVPEAAAELEDTACLLCE